MIMRELERYDRNAISWFYQDNEIDVDDNVGVNISSW